MTTTGLEMHSFVTRYKAQWSDVDQNGHMRTTAYLATAEDSRMQYFASHGFPMSEFIRLSIGPVVQSDEIRYGAELRLLDEAVLEMQTIGLSPDGARFGLRNIFTRSDGKVACTVSTIGGWLDLKKRRLSTPPMELLSLIGSLERSDDFTDLPSPIDQSRQALST